MTVSGEGWLRNWHRTSIQKKAGYVQSVTV